jgi:hypothetical protein
VCSLVGEELASVFLFLSEPASRTILWISLDGTGYFPVGTVDRYDYELPACSKKRTAEGEMETHG